jgi:hypothetical protein
MKKLLPLVFLLLASACGPRVPRELDEKIVVLEETGERVKLCWDGRRGLEGAWTFYQEVRVVTSTSTNAVWIPYGTGIQSE